MRNIISLYLSSFDTDSLGIANGINADPASISPNSSITINVNPGDTIQWLLSAQSDPNNPFSIDQYNDLPGIFSTYPTPLPNGWQAVFSENCPTGVYRVQINWSTTSGGKTQSSWASIYFNVATALFSPVGVKLNLIQVFMSYHIRAQIGIGLASNLALYPLNVSVSADDIVEFLFSQETKKIPTIEYVYNPDKIVLSLAKNGWRITIGRNINQLDIDLEEYDAGVDDLSNTGHALIRINAH